MTTPSAYPKGDLLTEGKTKQIFEVRGKPNLVLLVSKNDITAGDGARHDVMVGKAELSTQTTCNMFKMLKRHGLAVAYVKQYSETAFVAKKCTMLPYEVVVRRAAHGSYLKRYPDIGRGHMFSPPLYEFFLKTKGRVWGKYKLPCDDPLLKLQNEEVHLFNPGIPIEAQEPFLKLTREEVFFHNDEQHFSSMAITALRAFQVLEDAWASLGLTLVDYKVEFGLTRRQELLLADVIDNDSWRLLDEKENYLDKQNYRNGATVEDALGTYRRVAQLTERFHRA